MPPACAVPSTFGDVTLTVLLTVGGAPPHGFATSIVEKFTPFVAVLMPAVGTLPYVVPKIGANGVAVYSHDCMTLCVGSAPSVSSIAIK